MPTLDTIYAPIQSSLTQIEKQLHGFEKNLSRLTDTDTNPIIFNLSEGKKIRAALLLFSSGKAYSSDPVIETATAIELIHFASLVHDDILDQESERRGEQPLYKQLSTKKSLLLGDYILTKALQDIPETIYIKASKALLSIISEMCIGEFSQLQMKEDDIAQTQYRQNYYDVNFKKTALLFGKVCYIGSLFNNTLSDDQHSAFMRFGENFGMAFQFLDDTLEIYQQLSGEKEVHVFDAAQGIVTLPYLNYAENVLQIQTPEAFNQFKRNLKDPQKLNTIHQAMKNEQIFESVLDVIQTHIIHAKRALTGINGELTLNLFKIADHIDQKSQMICG